MSTIFKSNLPVSQNIVKYIDEIGIKQQTVAKRAGYTKQALNDMLNGRRIIRVCDVSKIAGALGVTPNDLFGTGQNNQAS